MANAAEGELDSDAPYEPDEIEHEAIHHCDDTDCEWTLGVGCHPVNEDQKIKCTRQYQIGDILPSTSCRCAGAGMLTARYGSIEEAFATMQSTQIGIDKDAFNELMLKYGVPAYTADWEFRQADKDNNGYLDLAEFKESAVKLMAATEGGDVALGSAQTRCCCNEKPTSSPKEICFDPKTKKSYKRSRVTERHQSNVSQSDAVLVSRKGASCRGSRCSDKSITQGLSLYPGSASMYTASAQGGGKTYVKFGEGLYEKSSQIYSECTEVACSEHHYTTYTTQHMGKWSKQVPHQHCDLNERCLKKIQLSYCGFRHETSLIRMKKIGTAGTCVAKEELQSKFFVGHLACPEGMYHRTRDNRSLQMCDCLDECP